VIELSFFISALSVYSLAERGIDRHSLFFAIYTFSILFTLIISLELVFLDHILPLRHWLDYILVLLDTFEAPLTHQKIETDLLFALIFNFLGKRRTFLKRVFLTSIRSDFFLVAVV
jgi:hypothetical protein